METSIDELSSRLSTLNTASAEFLSLDNHSSVSTYTLPSMSSCPMTTDNYKHLLVYHHQALILFDIPTLKVVFSLPTNLYSESPISDMCFHPISNHFLFSSSNKLFSLSSSQQVQIIHEFTNPIWSITYTSEYIFICYLFGFSLEQWKFNGNGGVLKNTWMKNELTEPLDIGINSIRAIDQQVGMTIKESDFSWRVDIFNAFTMNRTHRGRRIQQENSLSNWIGLLCPIDNYQWLFADGDKGLFLIGHNDQQEPEQQQIMKTACNAVLIRNLETNAYCAIIIQSYEGLHLYDIQNFSK